MALNVHVHTYLLTGSIYKLFGSLRFSWQPKDKIETSFADVLTEFPDLSGSFNIHRKHLPEDNAFFYERGSKYTAPTPPAVPFTLPPLLRLFGKTVRYTLMLDFV